MSARYKYSDAELIELGRSSLLESAKPPSIFKRAWDEVKEPWGIALAFIFAMIAMILNVFACLWLGDTLSSNMGGGNVMFIAIAVIAVLVSVAVWWYGLAILSLMDNTDE